MKKYNFDLQIDRSNTDSIKWSRYGDEVLPLWVADMDFAAPPQVIAALWDRISHPVFGYAGEGHQLLETICDWVYRRHAWRITLDQILLVPGVVCGMNWVAKSFGTPQESMIIQTPVYEPFFQVADQAGMRLIEAPLQRTKSGYEIDSADFEKRIANDTQLMILCNPHNPVGRVFTRQELEKLGEICLRHQVLICSDEIHCDLVYSGYKYIPIASLLQELAQNTVTLMAPSKTFNIPGLHFSFAVVANKELREKMENSRGGIVGHPGVLANVAAKAAFLYGEEWLDQLLSYLESNRDFLMDFIKKNLPDVEMVLPEATYLAWLDFRKLDLQPDPYNFFLEKAKVALNDGKWFGREGSGFLRLNFGCPRETLQEALQRMLAALN